MRATLFTYSTSLDLPITAAGQVHSVRRHLILRLSDQGVSGWGELSPQPEPLNGDPSFAAVQQEFESHLWPAYVAAWRREGALPHWNRVARFCGSRASSPWAVTLLEMAVLDLSFRVDNELITSTWPSWGDVGTLQTVSALNDEWPESSGAAQRIRLKVDARPLRAEVVERLAQREKPVLLDYNCSAPSLAEIGAHIRQVEPITEVVAVEQPFAPGNVVEHARLARSISVPISLDEGIRSTRDLVQAVRYEAATMVCLKPARLGGYAVTRTCAALARELGLRPYVGGFFEGQLGRTANAIVARNAVLEPSDIGAVASREALEWSPTSSGWGVEPSEQLIDSFTVLRDFVVTT